MQKFGIHFSPLLRFCPSGPSYIDSPEVWFLSQFAFYLYFILQNHRCPQAKVKANAKLMHELSLFQGS